MLYTTMLLHANILYAEFPFSSVPSMVGKSYVPVFKAILGNERIKVILNLSGFTLEVLNGEHPDIYPGSGECISLLKDLASSGRVEFTGTSWAHAVLPSMPLFLVEEDINLHKWTVERILRTETKGFFPPELGISPLLPGLLRKHGYSYCIVDKEFIGYTKAGNLNSSNDFEPVPESFMKRTAVVQRSGLVDQLKYLKTLNRKLVHETDFTHVEWLGAKFREEGSNSITAVPCDTVWVTYALGCFSEFAVMNTKALFKKIGKASKRYSGLFIPYSSDIEFYGHGGNTVKQPIPVERLQRFMEKLTERDDVTPVLPSEYLESSGIKKEAMYLKSGSWSSDKNFDLWDREEDNRQLNGLCAATAEIFREKHGVGGYDHRAMEILKNILLGYNSDGRGWTPHPEHRMFCFNRVLAARRFLGIDA